MLRLLILGAGGHGQVVADIALALAHSGASLQLAGFLDDDPRLWGQEILGAPVWGPTAEAPPCPYDAVLAGVGDNMARRRLYGFWRQRGAAFATLVHPAATVGWGAVLGPGAVLCAGAIAGTGSHIGRNVILNTGASVDHHSFVANHAHIAPGACLGGGTRVGKGALVGIGAAVLPQTCIGTWSTVGAGAVVTHNVPARQTVAGVPASHLAQDICRRRRA